MRRILLLISFLLLPVSSSVFASPFADALQGTVKLAGSGVAGTGFVVKKGEIHYLATAAHVFGDFKGGKCTMVYRAKREGEPSVRAEMEIAIRKEDKPLWKKHKDHDLAVLKITLPKDIECRPFPFESVVGEDMAANGKLGVGREICVPCYPVKTEANKAGWPILRRGTIASHPLTPLSEAPTFFIDASSFGGESGAPVVAWDGENVFVVGVVTSMQRQTDKTRTPMEERTVHTPLGLGIAVQSAFLRGMME